MIKTKKLVAVMVVALMLATPFFALPSLMGRAQAAPDPNANQQLCIDQGGTPVFSGGVFTSCDLNGDDNETTPADSNANTNASGDDGEDAGSTDDIDVCNLSRNVLSWIICPVLDTISAGVTFMQSVIDHLMQVDTTEVFDVSTQSGRAYYTAWNSFRLFAIAFIVITGLIMVIAQSLGLEIFDAYTLKKVIPRLFLAAIGISLSWYLLRFLADLTNVLGIGVRSIIYYPFKDLGGAGLQSTGGLLLGGLIGGTTIAVLTIGGALSLVATAGLAALIAFLVLIIRQMVLIFLILIAPLAIACYVLPNTQKMYSIWWDSVFKGFMMFPIITAFIATGRVFSVVASNAPGGNIQPAVNQVIAVIAFFLPYFALPFTFRLAGGAIATIGGLANDRSRGAFDRLKQYRTNAMAEGWQRKKNEKFFRGGTDTNFRGKINRGVANTLNAPGAIAESGNVFAPNRWSSAVRGDRSSRAMMEIERTMKENRAYQGWMHNDDLNRAASVTNNAGELRDYLVDNGVYEAGSRDLEDNVANIEAVRRTMSGDSFRAMTTRQMLAGGTAIKSSKEPGAPKTAAGEVIAAIARASVNDDALAGSLVANMRSDGMRAGRVDYAGAGFGPTIGEVQKMRAKLQKGEEISQQDILDATAVIHDDVYDNQGGYSLVNAGLKPDAVKEMAPVMQRHLDKAIHGGNDRDVKRELAAMKGVYENLQSSSPNKAKTMADGVFSTRVSVSDLSPGIRQAIGKTDPSTNNEVLTNAELVTLIGRDNEFREFHREWGEATAQHEQEFEAAMHARQAAGEGQGPGQPPPPGQ